MYDTGKEDILRQAQLLSFDKTKSKTSSPDIEGYKMVLDITLNNLK